MCSTARPPAAAAAPRRSTALRSLRRPRHAALQRVRFGVLRPPESPSTRSTASFSNDSTERFVTNVGGYSGSSNTFPGNITTGGIGIPGGCVGPGLVPVPSLGIACAFDPAKVKGVESIPGRQDLNAFGSAKFQITNNWQAYGTALYSKDKNHYVIQPSPQSSVFPYGPNGDLPGNITLQPTSPFYPHALAARHGVAGRPLDVRWRGFTNGFRDTLDTNEGSQVVVGMKGSFMDRWDVDASYSYSKGKTNQALNSGSFRVSQLLALLNSGNVNLFGDNTPAITDQIRATNVTGDVIKDEATNKTFNARSRASCSTCPRAPCRRRRRRPAQGAARPVLGRGARHRRRVGLRRRHHRGAGKPRREAAYGELSIPILRSLEASVAIRTDDYSDFGRTNNPKASLRWQPSRDILFRSSYGQGFLAPSLYQLFLPRQPGVSPTGLTDPDPLPVTHNTGTDCLTQFGVFFGGNPALKPETSEQATLGIVWEPNNAFRCRPTTSRFASPAASPTASPSRPSRRPRPVRPPGHRGRRRSGLPQPARPDHPHRAGLHQPRQHAHRRRRDVEAHYKWRSQRAGAACAWTCRARTTSATTRRPPTAASPEASRTRSVRPWSA